MDLQHKVLENGITQFMIHNESHSLLRPLTEELRNIPSVTYVSYVEVHPLKNEMKLLVKGEDNNEVQLVLNALKKLSDDLKEYKQNISEI